MKLVNERLHHIGILLVELERHRVSLERLAFVSKPAVDLAHSHVDGSLFWTQRFELLEHLKALRQAIKRHQNRYFLVLGQRALWIESLGAFKAIKGVLHLINV